MNGVIFRIPEAGSDSDSASGEPGAASELMAVDGDLSNDETENVSEVVPPEVVEGPGGSTCSVGRRSSPTCSPTITPDYGSCASLPTLQDRRTTSDSDDAVECDSP